jgi:enoyl-CoA hydratase/carnithine racemase
MLSLMDNALTRWEKKQEIKMVVVTSSSDRAFCAGVDLKAFYENGPENWRGSYALVELGYGLTRKLFHYSKPYLALMHGIVMGGGVGISLHGSHPIATDTMRFALPEVMIGFFPDVGSTYFLPRLPHRVGWYLAMTGKTITASDALALGLVKHVIQGEKREEFLSLLPDRLEEGLSLYKAPLYPPTLDFAKIEYAFSKPTLEEMIQAHGKEDFQGKCPSSIRIAFTQMQRGLHLSFDEAIAYELTLAKERLQSPDLYEGIRYRLVQKIANPNWSLSCHYL